MTRYYGDNESSPFERWTVRYLCVLGVIAATAIAALLVYGVVMVIVTGG